MADGVVAPNGSPGSYAPERRRFARQAVRGIIMKVPSLVDAEVIDIGVTGALIKCRCPLRVGDRVQLRLVLDQQPFVGTVSVVRVGQRLRSGRRQHQRRCGVRRSRR